jgi:hypothetical protein
MVFRTNNYSYSLIDRTNSDTTENASSSTTLTPVQLLALAIRKRRGLMDQKHKDLRRELLHTGVIQLLCKSLGESRAAKRRMRKNRNKKAKKRRWDVQNSFDHMGSGISHHPDSSNDFGSAANVHSEWTSYFDDGSQGETDDEGQHSCKRLKYDHEVDRLTTGDEFMASNSGF